MPLKSNCVHNGGFLLCDCDRPLKRMTVGMLLAALAFVAAALVQMQIDVSARVYTLNVKQSDFESVFVSV